MNVYTRRLNAIAARLPLAATDQPPDLDRLTPDEQRELDDILINVRPGDLSRLTDDELDRLRALTIRAGGA